MYACLLAKVAMGNLQEPMTVLGICDVTTTETDKHDCKLSMPVVLGWGSLHMTTWCVCTLTMHFQLNHTMLKGCLRCLLHAQ